MSRMLLVEDEAGLAMTIADLLSAAGHSVKVAGDARGAETLIGRNAFDLVILDVMLPGKDGFEFCKELRATQKDVAILMLTARTQVNDRVQGLKLGADDYLVKPFDPEELLARIEALLRRAGHSGRPPAGVVHLGDIEIDFERAALRRSGERLSTTGKELQLLEYLVRHRGRVLSREEILQNVWEYSGDVCSRTVDVHVAWLRQKLERNPQRPEYIHTIRGKGYRLSK